MYNIRDSFKKFIPVENGDGSEKELISVWPNTFHAPEPGGKFTLFG